MLPSYPDAVIRKLNLGQAKKYMLNHIIQLCLREVGFDNNYKCVYNLLKRFLTDLNQMDIFSAAQVVLFEV